MFVLNKGRVTSEVFKLAEDLSEFRKREIQPALELWEPFIVAHRGSSLAQGTQVESKTPEKSWVSKVQTSGLH